MRRTALEDRPSEQTLRTGHGEQHPDAHRTRGLAADRHVVRIATEGSDVLPHPPHRGDLIEETAVRDPVPPVQEALRTRSVIDRDAHEAITREATAIVPGVGASPERSAGDPYHHGKPHPCRIGRPDVEVQAVLA